MVEQIDHVAPRDTLGPARAVFRHVAGFDPSTPTLNRWMHKGTLQPDGTRRRLRYDRIGGRLYLRPSYVREFIGSSGEQSVPPVSAADRIAGAKRAERELADSGW